MKRFILLLIISILIIPHTLSGKHIHYSYTSISIGEGLSQANVESILLDSKGILWIGTRNGLNIYAQQQITHFFHEPENKYSLPDSHILHLAEDSLGNIWVATTQGLAQYDRTRKQFDTYTRGRVQSSLCVEGGILFGGDNVIYFYDYHTQQFKLLTYIHRNDTKMSPIMARVMKMLPLDKERAIIGTRKQGIFIYHYRTQTFELFTTEFLNTLLFSICLTSDNKLYVSYYGMGVVCYTLDGKKTATYQVSNSPLTNNYVMDIIEHQGKVWMATDGGGICLVDLASGEFSTLKHTTGDPTSLPFNSITELYKDENENLWLGSVRGGAIHVKESYIRTYQDVVMNHHGGLTEKSVTSLYEEPDGRLWIGTDGGGVNLYHPESDSFTHFPSTYGDKVVSMAGLSENELLVSIYTKGFFTFNKQTGQYRPFILKDQATNWRVCHNGYIPLAHRVNEDKIYLIGYEGWIYHLKNQSFTPLVLPEEYRKLAGALMVAYSNEEFVLLKQGSCAFMVNHQTDSVRLLTEVDANETIHSMTYDPIHQKVWIGTDKGLRYCQLETKECQSFETPLFNHVSYLTMDSKRRLWISAQNKLFSYSIDENKFSSWSTSDGYLPNEILPKYPTLCNDDFIYLCGTQGLVRIATNIKPSKDERPIVYLSDVSYNGESYLEPLKDDRMEVPWDYRSLVLTFGTKSKDIFQKQLLKYTIRSSSGENRFESYDPTVNLSSLAPDKYTLFVSCYTKDGDETEPLQVLSLVVTPPWYKTTWFMIIIVCCLIGASSAIGRWIHQKKTRQMKGDVGEFLQTVLQTLDESDETTVAQPVINEVDKAFLEKMDKLIYDHLSNEELSAKFLTDQLAMSRASLYNKVKALTGMGVNDYINRIRIERSVYLLTNTDMSINEISYEVGFSYPRYFSTSFKQMKGMTPTRFKEENKKKSQP